MAKNAGPTPMRMVLDNIQAQGRYTFTGRDAAHAGPRSEAALGAALRRLKRQGRIVSPRRGFYVLVPPEYRAAGSPPASWFIDDLMRFLRQPYYVGVLSAAAIHGAAHQQPQVFQVITDRPSRPAHAGRVHIAFHVGRPIERRHTELKQPDTGTMVVATPETTAFDLVRYPAAAGHLNNVATVLRELAERLDASSLVRLADAYAISDVQRLGYLLEHGGRSDLTEPLAIWLASRRFRPVAISPGEPRGEARLNARWRVILNETIEVDL